VPEIYVTGHRNPDTDSIASAIGYAELKRRLDPRNEYLAVRLGECNAQTGWLLERSEATEPPFLPHVMLRACDLMRTGFPIIAQEEPIRAAGLAPFGVAADDSAIELPGVMSRKKEVGPKLLESL
jgi:manganese-dependent inorganic pyrophosphatase